MCEYIRLTDLLAVVRKGDGATLRDHAQLVHAVGRLPACTHHLVPEPGNNALRRVRLTEAQREFIAHVLPAYLAHGNALVGSGVQAPYQVERLQRVLDAYDLAVDSVFVDGDD